MIGQCFDRKEIFVLINSTFHPPITENSNNSIIPITISTMEDESLIEKYRRHRNVLILNQEIIKNMTHPASGVVIIVKLSTNMTELLYKFRNSIWWRHDVPVLLANKDERNGCDMAKDFLTKVWAFKILNVVYLCFNSNNILKMFTLNPYQSTFHEFWTKIGDSSLLKSKIDNFDDAIFQKTGKFTKTLLALFWLDKLSCFQK
ncbi:hypothetical protein QAD02_006397 [Eretmocerus hayati]|uniref:Uncharacterized protein n=2 Tax=Eretmocerus hayati TaxID=131215 RepID=A0ACC2N145_9HYME|nr:hypothetical protein QAD02_006394 [Eretmocerus hayati]KAJ8664735.1 hypothetical protein QAD02_006397 [Eretmocerus hayati]